MWHTSVSASRRSYFTHRLLEMYARRALKGVGDAQLGEWVERRRDHSMNFLHIRRRLTEEEAEIVGPVIDVRGTARHEEAARKAAGRTGMSWEEIMAMELPK